MKTPPHRVRRGDWYAERKRDARAKPKMCVRKDAPKGLSLHCVIPFKMITSLPAVDNS